MSSFFFFFFSISLLGHLKTLIKLLSLLENSSLVYLYMLNVFISLGFWMFAYLGYWIFAINVLL